MKIHEWIFENNEFSLQSFEDEKSLAKDEVLIRPLKVGICGSDLFAMEFVKGERTLRLGHEWVGKIIKSHSEKFKVGDHVTSPAVLGCGQCDSCKKGESNLCLKSIVIGGEEIGALRELLRLPSKNLVKVSEKNLDASVLLEIAAVGFEATRQIRQLGLHKDEKVLIFGGGPVGLFVALQAKRDGQSYLLVEQDSFRIGLAKELGLNVESTSLALMNKEYANSFQYVVDCSGDGNGRSGFWKYFHFFSGVSVKLLVVAKYINDPTINSNLFANKNATVKWMRGMSPETIEETKNYWKEGLEELTNILITQQYDFSEVPQAFERALRRDQTVKVVINLKDQETGD